MFCNGCGARMSLVQRKLKGGKVFLRYACPRASCQKESLVVEPAEDACPEAAARQGKGG